MKFKKIGVLGAGVMGASVAQNLAQYDFQTVLIDLSDEILERSKSSILQNIRFMNMFGKRTDGGKKEDPYEVIKRITFSTDYNLLKDSDYVIENVIEKWDIKKEVYAQIDKICSPECIFAADTSCITITRIASATKRPSQVIGIHFMNPVPMKNTVEVIRGYHTSDETVEATKALLAKIDKESIMVNDGPGFVSNRTLMLMINEAIYTVRDQVASAEDVDQIFKSCFGHKMGPLETADLIGLDTILYSLEVLSDSFRDSKYRPCPLLTKMVDAGLLGKKSGEGFYTYPTVS